MWQDTVIALCQLAFLPSMLPSIFGNDKPAFSTSIMNAVIVSVIVVTFVTLRLWFAVATGVMTVILWTILAIQQYKLQKNR